MTACEMRLDALLVDAGWRRPDPVTALKLQASLRRFGQLRPVLVRTARDGMAAVVDGHGLVAAMRALGWETCRAWNLGALSDIDAAAVGLALEIRHETSYAAMARAVAALLAGGATPEGLSVTAPFDARYLAYMDALTRFDWSQFADVPPAQAEMDWSGVPEPEEPALLPRAVMEEVEKILEHETPATVVRAVREATGRRRRDTAPSLFELLAQD